jgi:hypothetical protein
MLCLDVHQSAYSPHKSHIRNRHFLHGFFRPFQRVNMMYLTGAFHPSEHTGHTTSRELNMQAVDSALHLCSHTHCRRHTIFQLRCNLDHASEAVYDTPQGRTPSEMHCNETMDGEEATAEIILSVQGPMCGNSSAWEFVGRVSVGGCLLRFHTRPVLGLEPPSPRLRRELCSQSSRRVSYAKTRAAN